MSDTENYPLGHIVTNYHVIGREHDIESRWIGADLMLHVKPVGSFFLNVVTKGHYLNEGVMRSLEGVEHLEKLLEEPPEEERPPFVLNDAVITDEVLRRKFLGRVVEQDLADCLWRLANGNSAA